MSAVLRIENLNYKDILNDVSFKLEKNTFNVLLGPNGTGKTTLVKCLSGLLEYNGNIYFNNCLINKDRDVDNMRDMGFVLDLSPVLDGSVMDNLMLPLLNLGYSEKYSKNKIYSISDKLGLGFILMKNVSELRNIEKKIFNFLRGIIHSHNTRTLCTT